MTQERRIEAGPRGRRGVRSAESHEDGEATAGAGALEARGVVRVDDVGVDARVIRHPLPQPMRLARRVCHLVPPARQSASPHLSMLDSHGPPNPHTLTSTLNCHIVDSLCNHLCVQLLAKPDIQPHSQPYTNPSIPTLSTPTKHQLAPLSSLSSAPLSSAPPPRAATAAATLRTAPWSRSMRWRASSRRAR
jgi:hypothetical protein